MEKIYRVQITEYLHDSYDIYPTEYNDNFYFKEYADAINRMMDIYDNRDVYHTHIASTMPKIVEDVKKYLDEDRIEIKYQCNNCDTIYVLVKVIEEELN